MLKEKKRNVFIIVFLVFMNCSSDNVDKLWNFSIKAEIYEGIFHQDSILFATDRGVFSYNLVTRKKDWYNDKINGLSLSMINNRLVGTDSKTNSICFLDIRNGQIEKTINVNDYIYRIQVKNETDIVFIEHGISYLLRRYNDTTGEISNLYKFNHYPRNLEYSNGNIFLTTQDIQSSYYSLLFIIDESNCNFTSLNPIRYYFGFVYFQDCVFYIDNKKELVKADKNGNELRRYQLPITMPYIYMKPFEEKILIYADSVYIFDVNTEKFIEIYNNDSNKNLTFGLSATINGDDIIFADRNTVHYYNINNSSHRELYNLNGMEVFKIFSNDDWLILILSDNIRLTLADNHSFTIVAMKYRLDTYGAAPR